MRALVLVLSVSGCRYLAPASPPVSADRPLVTAPGSAPESSRTSITPANRCGVACGVGFHCDLATASCAPDIPGGPTSDGGPAWMPSR